MFSHATRFMVTIATALMLIVQGLMVAPVGCGCGGCVEKKAVTTSCCQAALPATSQHPSCCAGEKCACGNRCGAAKTACECGCQSHSDEPASDQPSEQRSCEVKLAFSTADFRFLAIPDHADDILRNRSRRVCSCETSLQVQLCKWQV